MEHFIVSARKYRPNTFEDVVGQGAITKTLDNAIANNHLAQALLFTGPRGVGKTTCARILAKKINNDGTHHENEDFAFNIFELDAASNNSVDDIRSLTDQVRIPPQIGNYKVYIIDEVHMLSTAAFNAFLKTLEEPPQHAIFILATTEKHKIIPTILSRCQIFDFKRITVNDIKEQLHKVANAEGIEAEDDALHIIAQKADGAMRDALSIFDRVVSFSGKQLSRQAVTENLNVLDYTYYFEITQMLLGNDIPKVLTYFDTILSKGFDGHHFISGLASHFRDLLVCKNPETISLLEVGDQVKVMYKEQSENSPHEFLMQGIQLANDCDLKYKNSRNQRLLVELCLLQLASLTAVGEKKNLDGKPYVIPPSQFKDRPSVELEAFSKENVASTLEIKKEAINPETKDNNDLNAKSTLPKPQLRDSKLLEKRAKRVSALSLKSVEKKQELQKEIVAKQVAPENLPTEKFSEEEMLHAWKAYTQKVGDDGKYNLQSQLAMGEPKMENHLIHLVFPNETIKKDIEREKQGLLNYLRSELNNYDIDLSIEVIESEIERYAYTPREKYEKLREKNPLLDSLRKEFDLDV